jgi:hypothetical protein
MATEVSQKPTFVATDRMHQCYPDKCAEMNQPNPPGPDDPLSSRNAILYCEMVDGHPRPSESTLTHLGNFTTQPSGYGQQDQIDGTFIISHHTFMEKWFLPQLQLLARGMEIIHVPREGGMTNDGYWWGLDYHLGFNPRYPSGASDPVHSFKPKNINDDLSQDSGYVWHKENHPRDLVCHRNDSGYDFDFLKMSMQGKCLGFIGASWPLLMFIGFANIVKYRMWINVTWDEGASEIQLIGQTWTLEHHEMFYTGGVPGSGDCKSTVIHR